MRWVFRVNQDDLEYFSWFSSLGQINNPTSILGQVFLNENVYISLNSPFSLLWENLVKPPPNEVPSSFHVPVTITWAHYTSVTVMLCVLWGLVFREPLWGSRQCWKVGGKVWHQEATSSELKTGWTCDMTCDMTWWPENSQREDSSRILMHFYSKQSLIYGWSSHVWSHKILNCTGLAATFCSVYLHIFVAVFISTLAKIFTHASSHSTNNLQHSLHPKTEEFHRITE